MIKEYAAALGVYALLGAIGLTAAFSLGAAHGAELSKTGRVILDTVQVKP